jgi:hypothetical protein
MRQYNYKKLTYEQIEKIIVGDEDAMAALVKHYTPYIKRLSCGNQDTEDKIIARLMGAVLRFKMDYEPKQR